MIDPNITLGMIVVSAFSAFLAGIGFGYLLKTFEIKKTSKNGG